MDIKYLKEFVTLARTGSFLESAELLDSSQSMLSKHIKSLEAELGCSLFNRTTRKVEISEFGSLLLPYAIEIVEAQEEFTSSLKKDLEAEREILTLGTIPLLAEYNLTDVLIKFKELHPLSTVNTVQEGSEVTKTRLRAGKFEVAFIQEIEDSDRALLGLADLNETDRDIVKIPYLVDDMVVVVPCGHPAAHERTVSLTKLANERFLFIEKNTLPYQLSMVACQKAGITPLVAATDPRHENIIDLVADGLGIAILMKRMALYFTNPKTTFVEITPATTTQIYLCYLANAGLSQTAQAFIEFVKSVVTKE